MKYSVVFSPAAVSDLEDIHAYIESDSGAGRAISWIRGVRDFCLNLETAPQRGMPRDDISPGLRTIGFRRQATVAIIVSADVVTIHRILYRGRDVDAALTDSADA